MKKYTVTLVIPTYRPGEKFRQVLARLRRQSVRPDRFIIINTEEKYFDPQIPDLYPGAEIFHIRKEEFDHGGTRAMAASMADTDLIMFMTMDALPADRFLVEKLTGAFEDPRVAAAYARQLPNPDCRVLERYTRSFNYGPESRVRTKEDMKELGIKTFFCSDVCAAYRRADYEEAGGFETHTIFNEDMILAGKLILAGRAVAYCAGAKVRHSHNYSGLQQFHRNFDLGVSQAQHSSLFGQVSSESEGIALVTRTAGWLLRTGRPHLLPQLVWQSGWKYLGYRLGKAYRRLPGPVIRACTMNRQYWKQEETSSADSRTASL